MLGPLGIQEIVLIAAVALMVFGPKRLSEMASTTGRAIGRIRRAMDDVKDSVEREMVVSLKPSAPSDKAAQAPAPDLPPSAMQNILRESGQNPLAETAPPPDKKE